LVIALSLSFEVTFQIREAGLPKCAVALDPPRDPLERHRVEAVHALAPRLPVSHQSGLAKHANVLGNSRTAQPKVRRQSTCPRGTGSQAIEDGAPGGIGDGSKDVFVGSRAVHDE
jgi:hypothetical protein